MLAFGSFLSSLFYVLILKLESTTSTGLLPTTSPKVSFLSSIGHEIAEGLTADLVVQNMYFRPPAPLLEIAKDSFPQTKPPSVLPELPPRGYTGFKAKLDQVIKAGSGAVSYLLGNHLPAHDVYQRAAIRATKYSTHDHIISLAQEIIRLPLHNIDLDDDLGQNLMPRFQALIKNGMNLLNDGTLTRGERLWLHQTIKWLGELSPNKHFVPTFKKPHEAELTRAELERYLLQDTLLKEKTYVPVNLLRGSPGDGAPNGIVERLARVKLLKDIKSNLPQLFYHTASSKFEEMFEVLMTIKTVEEPALEESRLQLLATLYSSLHHNLAQAPKKERILSHSVLEHLLNHVPQTRQRFERAFFADVIFRDQFFLTEAMARVERMLSSNHVTSEAKALVIPLGKYSETNVEDIKLALRGIISRRFDHEQAKQIYLATSAVSRLNIKLGLYLERQLESSKKLLRRVSIIWELMYPTMSLEKIPKDSYEYQLFKSRPDLFENAGRFLLTRRWETNSHPTLAALERRIESLPLGWYKVHPRDASPLLERILELISIHPLPFMTPTDSPSAYVPMRLYELLAQVLKHNWSTSINFLTKELDDNVQLYVNINTLSHMNLRREPRLSPFAYKLGTELANWFFDRADLPNVSSRWTWTAHRARLNRVQRLNQYHRQDLTTRQD